MRLAISVLVGVVGCSDGPSVMVIPTEPDARCPIYHTSTCNPLTQTGCGADERCSWLVDQVDPPIGHVGCTPRGEVPIGGSCTRTPLPPGPCQDVGSYDDCVIGAACFDGVCKQICDVTGGQPACDADHACVRQPTMFEVGGNAVAGACVPGCDPLTQELALGADKIACGSPTPTAPTQGCYGYDDYTCSTIEPDVLDRLDRDVPRTNTNGNAYLNGCAPGFIPFHVEATGSTTTLCSGFCAALEIDDTQPGNNQGDATALAKMPTDPEPVAGHGICSAQYKGSSASSSCRFLWPYVEDDQGALPLAFEQGPYLDTLGVCFEYTQFTYDDDMNDQTANVPYADCGALPKRSLSTTGTYDDAADWGCQKRAHSELQRNAALKQVRIPTHAPLELVRHLFAD